MTPSSWAVLRMPVEDGSDLAEHGPFDSLLCDPPYGLKFMGNAWDHGVPSAEVWRDLREHLRPGANLMAFGGARTYHRLACAIEDAGFEIRDSIAAWMYGQGWPKPGNVSKYIDKRLGKERKFVSHHPDPRPNNQGRLSQSMGAMTAKPDITSAGSPEAARFDGWHANISPAWEPVILARKPLDDGLANNALEHGLAGLNVAGCRIGTSKRVPGSLSCSKGYVYGGDSPGQLDPNRSGNDPTVGRWPANVVLACEELICGPGDPRELEHKPGCHVYELDQQSAHKMHAPGTSSGGDGKPSYIYGHGLKGRTFAVHNDPPGAAKFFYCAKVSARERGVSAHPCMKPIALCTWLARLLLPPPRADGQPRTILIPYSGSGSEMIGALAAGWDRVIGIEWDDASENPGKRPDYWADVAEHRIREWEGSLGGEHLVDDVARGPTQLGLGLG